MRCDLSDVDLGRLHEDARPASVDQHRRRRTHVLDKQRTFRPLSGFERHGGLNSSENDQKTFIILTGIFNADRFYFG